MRLPEFKARPFLNTQFVIGANMPEPRSYDLSTLMYWVKRTPECIGIVKRIATDIVTSIDFASVESQKTGRPSEKFQKGIEDRAKVFSRRNNLKRKLLAAVMDMLITGDGYIWRGRSLRRDNKLDEKFGACIAVSDDNTGQDQHGCS